VENRIKICYVIDSLVIGGANKLTLDIINLLDKSKFEICLVVLEKLKKEYPYYKYIPGYVRLINLDFENYLLPWKIYNLEKIFVNQDIIHSCLENSNFYCSIVNLFMLRKKIFIATIHGIDGVFIDDDFLKKELRKISSWKYYIRIKYISTYLLKYYNGFIAVCNSLKLFLIDKRKINNSKINVIYHGIEISKYNDNIDSDKIIEKRNELGINGNDFVLGYCGRLSYGKGLEKLLDVFQEIVSLFPNFKLILIGDGERKEFLSKKISDLSLGKNCIITGFQKEVTLFYKILDVFVLPSASESTSMVTQEAMYNKVIPLCSNVGGIAEIITDGYNGFMFNEKNFNEFKDKLIYIYENRNNLNHIKENAHKTIADKFNLKKNVINISNYIEKLYANHIQLKY
jgi:glycosyltransferase involved in cell wall biosynthesis